MKSIFSQTVIHSVSNTTYSTYQNNIPDLIHKHTNLNYTCTQTDTEFFLKPTFNNMPYRNSFAPEIDIVVSYNDTHSTLYIQGQPIKPVRVFMTVWFSVLMLIEVFLLIFAVNSGFNNLFPVFIPVIMCVFGYSLCKIATNATFKIVVKSLQKELAN